MNQTEQFWSLVAKQHDMLLSTSENDYVTMRIVSPTVYKDFDFYKCQLLKVSAA